MYQSGQSHIFNGSYSCGAPRYHASLSLEIVGATRRSPDKNTIYEGMGDRRVAPTKELIAWIDIFSFRYRYRYRSRYRFSIPIPIAIREITDTFLPVKIPRSGINRFLRNRPKLDFLRVHQTWYNMPFDSLNVTILWCRHPVRDSYAAA